MASVSAALASHVAGATASLPPADHSRSAPHFSAVRAAECPGRQILIGFFQVSGGKNLTSSPLPGGKTSGATGGAPWGRGGVPARGGARHPRPVVLASAPFDALWLRGPIFRFFGFRFLSAWVAKGSMYEGGTDRGVDEDTEEFTAAAGNDANARNSMPTEGTPNHSH